MKAVLEFIEEKKEKYAQLPLFEFMRDKDVDPRQRLAFAPCFAHFVMSFSDLNKYVLRDESCSDRVQKIVNSHTYEDANHWPWFLEDLEELELNQSRKLSETLRFLWSQETKFTRQLSYQLAAMSLNAVPIEKVIVIEALEATGHIMFLESVKIAAEIQEKTKKKCRYFGDIHLARETGHTTGSSDPMGIIEEIELTEVEREKAFELVEKVFEIFTNCTHELLDYAQKHWQEFGEKGEDIKPLAVVSSSQEAALVVS